MDLFILALYIGYFTINAANSAIAPFFPQRAVQQGISQSLIGIIFAIHPFGNFVCTFVLGKRLQGGQNRKKFTILGILLTALGILIFAFVFQIEDYSLFLLTTLFSRIILGIGQSLFCTPAFAYIPVMYKSNFEEVCAYMESVGAIGLMMGPLLGSLLLQLFGYSTPFIFFSIICVLLIPLLNQLIPQSFEKQESSLIEDLQEEEEEFQINYTEIFKKKYLLLNYIMIFFPTCGLLYLDPTMGVYFSESYGLDDFQIGLIFTVSTVVYIALTPYGAKQIKKYQSYESLLLCGCLLMGISFIFLGPDPATLLPQSIYVVVFANFIIGIACVLLYIPALPQLYKIIKYQHPEDNDNMVGDISSALYNTSYALGEFAGPLIGGFFAQYFSFPRASSLFGISMIVFGFYYYKKGYHGEEVHYESQQNISLEKKSLIYEQQMLLIDQLSMKANKIKSRPNFNTPVIEAQNKYVPKYYTPVLDKKVDQESHFIILKKKQKKQQNIPLNEVNQCENNQNKQENGNQIDNNKKSSFQMAFQSEKDIK